MIYDPDDLFDEGSTQEQRDCKWDALKSLCSKGDIIMKNGHLILFVPNYEKMGDG